MTTPMVDGRPADGTGAGPPLVVQPNRPQARRMLLLGLGGTVLVIPGQLWRVADGEGWDVVFSSVFISYWVWVVGYLAFVWGRMLGADALAEIGPWGIRVNDLGRGWVSLPWESVGSVRGRYRRVVVKPAAGVDPSTPGTEWPPDRSTARRARGRRGLSIPLATASHDKATVLAAVHHFSGGRL